MIIRTFKEQDIEHSINLFMEVFNQAPWNNQWTQEVTADLFHDFIHTPGFLGYIAEVEDTVVAVIVGKEKKWWRGNEYVVEEFFVKHDLQGQGIGTRMLEFIYSDVKSRGIGNIILLTDTFAPAYTFYVNKGFTENQTIRLLFRNI